MFENLDLEKLRSLTEGQVKIDQLKITCKDWIDNLTRKQLILLILALKTLDIDTFEIQDREEGQDEPNKGQIWRLRTFKDALGNITRKQRINWTYKPPQPDGNCPVDTITIKEMDANDNIISEKVMPQ